MNKNIEVINKHLWAVKFSHIPFIPEIEYKPDPQIPDYMEFGRVTKEGLLILNKDHPGFMILKDLLPKLMKKKDKQLKKETKAAQVLKYKNDWQNVYAAAIQVELERRSKERR